MEPPQAARSAISRRAPILADVIAAAAEFTLDDCVCEVDTAWDLWQFAGDWKLAPASVTLAFFGPMFDNELGDHIRIDFGF